MLTCSKCGASDLKLDDFYGRVVTHGVCKRCRRRQVCDRVRTTMDVYLRRLYTQCKMRHVRDHRAEPFIDWNSFLRLFVQQNGVCAETGARFDHASKSLSPSPDRVDNARGYVCGNLRFVTWQVNNARGALTIPEFRRMCESVVWWSTAVH